MYFLIFILLELISLRILIAPLPPSVLEYNSYESKHLNSSKDLQTLSKCLHSSWASYFYIVMSTVRFSKTERIRHSQQCKSTKGFYF